MKVHLFQTSSKELSPQLKKLTNKEHQTFFSLGSSEKKTEFLASRLFLKKLLPKNKNHSFIRAPHGKGLSWPLGTTGSLSHKNGLIAIVLSKNADCRVGVDLEFVAVSRKVFERFTEEEEREYLLSLKNPFRNLKELYSLVFSIKESLFKAFSPLYPQKDFVLSHFRIEKLNPKDSSFLGIWKETGEKSQGQYHFLKNKRKKQEPERMILTSCTLATRHSDSE